MTSMKVKITQIDGNMYHAYGLKELVTMIFKQIYKFNASSTRIPIVFFTDLEQIILTFT